MSLLPDLVASLKGKSPLAVRLFTSEPLNLQPPTIALKQKIWMSAIHIATVICRLRSTIVAQISRHENDDR